jgi:hypothetical protein
LHIRENGDEIMNVIVLQIVDKQVPKQTRLHISSSRTNTIPKLNQKNHNRSHREQLSYNCYKHLLHWVWIMTFYRASPLELQAQMEKWKVRIWTCCRCIQVPLNMIQSRLMETTIHKFWSKVHAFGLVKNCKNKTWKI